MLLKVAMLFPHDQYVGHICTSRLQHLKNHIIEAGVQLSDRCPVTSRILTMIMLMKMCWPGPEIKDGKIVVRDEEYSVLLLAAVTTIKKLL